MVVFSALRAVFTRSAVKPITNAVVQRNMSGHHRVLPFLPSKWQWIKFKDMFHFYVLLGVIPLGTITLLANVFVGPATLQEIPDGYVPKYWEYYRSPITRFLAKYMLHSPQQEYEKFLHHLFEEEEKRKIREVERKVKDKMAERSDYQAYYYRPVMGKYHRMTRDTAEYIKSISGE